MVHPQVDPLHQEDLHIVIRTLSEPTPDQRLAAAAIALTNATNLSATALAQLRWADVAIKRNCAVVRPPPRTNRRAGVVPGRPLVISAGPDERVCPVALLRQARLATGSTGLLFGKTGNLWDVERLRSWLTLLPTLETGSWLRPKAQESELLAAIESVLEPAARQIRDRTLLLLGYGAALRATEAFNLDQAAVAAAPSGLLIAVPGRRSPAALPRDDRPWLCPVRAWQEWTNVLAQAGLVGPDRPAFVHLQGSVVTPVRLSREGLRLAVRLACAGAGLHGKYGFVSLRTGFIRTAIRDDSPLYRVAAQADFATLSGLARHERREQILRDNVAARLGL
ncbi:hypothetical protein [Nocardioides sp. LS1]|uniref:hypothetical protein n=1 Tax=Nocardioides sp. LS1 TaxID=1027620 RepID=UPI000F618BEC|nr:hypothetical protein [Nocardioides sp. LS1]